MKSAPSSHPGFRVLQFALCILLAAGCSKAADPAARGPKAAVPVRVAAVSEMTAPVQIKTFGNVQAYASVAIRAQVNVELMAIGFKEGEEIKKDRVLFTLDTRPFEAAVRQAEATVKLAEAARKQAEAAVIKDKALAKNARVEATRAEALLKQGAFTQEQRDNALASQDALDAAVEADLAAVEAAKANVDAGNAAAENAKVQLSYCTIRSPMDGRAGSRTVDVGNIIKAVDMQPMVVINQIHPIYAGFSIPEQQLASVRKRLADKGKPMAVQAFIPGDDGKPAVGALSFVDNVIDQTTGTILLKATFPNDDDRLWPGQYVNIVLTLTEQPHALVIPAVAVQTGQKGQYVFVVKEDHTVEARPVTAGQTLDDSIVIEKGLKAGENVVTDGQFLLVPGAAVEINTASAAPKETPESAPEKPAPKGARPGAEKAVEKGTGG